MGFRKSKVCYVQNKWRMISRVESDDTKPLSVLFSGFLFTGQAGCMFMLAYVNIPFVLSLKTVAPVSTLRLPTKMSSG